MAARIFPQRLKWLSLAIVAAMGVIFVAGVWMARDELTPSKILSSWSAATAKKEDDDVKASIKTCRNDPRSCQGGFVIFRFSSKVLRIESCGRSCADRNAVDPSELVDYLYAPREVVRIVKPQDVGWREAATLHAEQYIPQQPKK